MNIRLITIIIFVLIITGGLVVFFMNGQNTKELALRMNSTTDGKLTPGGSESAEITSSDNRVMFQYPNSWTLRDTTVGSLQGKFGKILQSWTLTSSKDTNSATVTIEIESGGSNLAIEELVDCGMKTTSCDKIGIDNEQFIKSVATLNSGAQMITVATFYDSNILRATAMIPPGPIQEKLRQEAEAILMSFHFVEK